MKHLITIAFVIYLPITANLTQPHAYCHAEMETPGTWVEYCTEVQQDGTRRTCETQYVDWTKVIEVCE